MATLAELRTKAGAAGTEHKKKLRQAVSIGVGSVVGTIAFLLLTVWIGSWISSTPETTTASPERPRILTLAEKCPGKVQTLEVADTRSSTINPHGCSFTFEVVSGTVIFGGPDGEEKWWPGKAAVGHKTFHTEHAKAESGAARFKYLLCPPHQPARIGWSCG